MGEDFIIVGSDGTEHHFPEGADPQRAIATVRQQEAKVNAPSALEMATHSGRLAPDEGKPGLLKGMLSMGEGMAHPGIDTKTGQAKGLLGTLGDVSSLLIPSALGFEGRTVLDAGSRYMQGVKGAASETHSLRDVATLPVRAYNKVKDALPSSNEKAVEEFLGPTRGNTYTPKPPTINGVTDVIDRNMPPVKSAAVPKPPMAKAPTLEDALLSAMEESRNTSEPITKSTAAASAETAGGGAYKQSWTKTKKQNLGGYDSGNPPPRESAPVAEPVPEPDVTVTSPADKPKLSAPEVAAELRRQYGSRDGGRMLYGSGGDTLSPVDRAAAIKRLAPGPSRIPATAQTRIDAAGAPRDLSLEEALRNIILSRNPPE